tara:strand:+ start:71 stop:847 length:777 start_codon:yes stop_codon:yes gene_type:complete
MLTVDFEKFELRAGDLLLDLGCGFGRHTYEALVRGAHVVSCDMAMPELEAIKNTAPMLIDDGLFDGQLMHTQVQGDGTRLPYPDNTFDKIIASEVLEHIPDDVAAYDEFFRILKPGGMLAATVPATFPEKICWKLSDEYYAPKAEGGHVRIYTENEVRSKLEGAGFDPGLSYKAHALHAPYWWIRCAVGVNNEVDDNWTVKQYHKLLEWDIVSQPWITRTAEKLLNPLLGKSLVVQATKSPLRTEKLSQIREAADASA